MEETNEIEEAQLAHWAFSDPVRYLESFGIEAELVAVLDPGLSAAA